MQRAEMVKILQNQLEKLRDEEHVADLMRNGREKELNYLAEELDFTELHEFCKNRCLCLDANDEIPKNCEYEMVFYVNQSGLDDAVIFKDYNDFRKRLLELEEEPAATIAVTMITCELCECTINELLAKKPRFKD